MNDQPPMPPIPHEKKGIPALGWVGIGCGTLLLIAVIVLVLLVGMCRKAVGDLSEFKRNPEKAAAELMVRMNPDLTKVSENEAAGEMTIRTKDGQEVTLSYKDISEGKFTLKDAKGSTTQIGQTDLGSVPNWVPRPPEVKTIHAAYQPTEAGKMSGLFSATSGTGIDRLDEFFTQEAAKLGFGSSSRSSTNVNGVENRTLSFDGGGRQLNIVLTAKPGEDVQVNVGYEEKK